MFARIAAETFERGEYLWPLEQIGERVADFLRRLPNAAPNDETRGADAVKTIEAQHGIFVERAHDIYSFAHLTFQEYYAARYLAEHPAALPNLIANHAYEGRWENRWQEVFLLTAEMLADADEFFVFWLDKLDDMARCSDRLISFLKSVETQTSNLPIDNNVDEKCRAVFLSYTPMQCRAAAIHSRMQIFLYIAFAADFAADTYAAADAAYAYADSTDVADVVAAYDATKVAVNVVNAVKIAAIKVATAADIVADTNDRDEWLKQAIWHSQAQGLTVLVEELQAVKLPKNRRNKKAWREVTRQLLTIFRAYFPAAKYELTKEAGQVVPYLESTALLLRCLKNACVSNRAAIEDRLLRPPVAECQ